MTALGAQTPQQPPLGSVDSVEPPDYYRGHPVGPDNPSPIVNPPVEQVPYAVVEVSPGDVGVVAERIAKINKRAAREGLGDEAFRYTVEIVDREQSTADEFDGVLTKRIVAVAVVTVWGDVVKIAGWQFVATLTWDAEAGLITRAVPGSDVDLGTFRDATPWCDHCRTRRQRVDTYALRNEAGELKQVGSTCIATYLGLKPSLWILAESTWAGLDEGCATFEPRWATDQVLATTAACVQTWGWLSKTKAEWAGGCPTSAYVNDVLRGWLPVGRNAADVEYREQLIATAERAEEIEADGGVVARIRAAVAAMEPGREYVDNLQAAVGASSVSARNIGLVASAIAVLVAAERRAAEVKAVSGELVAGNRNVAPLGLVAKVTGVTTVDSQYGTTTIYTLKVTAAKDPGNVAKIIKWFSSRPQGWDKEDVVKIVAGTVKGPDEWQGFVSTKITRVKWERVETPEAAQARLARQDW